MWPANVFTRRAAEYYDNIVALSATGGLWVAPFPRKTEKRHLCDSHFVGRTTGATGFFFFVRSGAYLGDDCAIVVAPIWSPRGGLGWALIGLGRCEMDAGQVFEMGGRKAS